MTEYEERATEILKMLEFTPEWENRYAEYAINIQKNKGMYKKMRQKFRVRTPLFSYTCISTIKDNKYQYDLRFRGQSIATISVGKKNGKVYITTLGKDDKNENFFECLIKLPKDTLWDSKEASKFRSFFVNKNNYKIRSQEHADENMLLNHFRDKKSENKKLLYIQPITLCDAYFQMPTPLNASKQDSASYGYHWGGGIDIMARIGKGRGDLAVIELKDENNKKEPIEIVIKQAIAYATFIEKLLRSKSGEQWWQLFGRRGNIPSSLTIYTIVAMPNIENAPYFVGDKIQIGNDFLELHYITYDKKGNYELGNINTSLTQCKVSNLEM